jgi:glucan 1,3-beta-glucosidase
MAPGYTRSSSRSALLFLSRRAASLIPAYFQYGQTCIASSTCQATIIDIDSATSPIHIYQLTTLGVTNALSVNGAVFGNNAVNANGYTVRDLPSLLLIKA